MHVRPRTRRDVRRGLISGMLAVLALSACAATDVQQETTPSSAPTAAATPEPTAAGSPAGTPTSSATPAPSAMPVAGPVEVGTWVTTTADRLKLREAAGLHAPYRWLLGIGEVATVVDGPVDRDGYRWWQLAWPGLPYASGCITVPEGEVSPGCWPPGWVAGADLDGNSWLTPAPLDCAPPPTTVEEAIRVQPGVLMHCFGGEELRLRAFLAPQPPEIGGHECYPGYDVSPGWLGPCAVVFLQGLETEFMAAGPELAANLDPSLGSCDFGGLSPDNCPLVPHVGSWITAVARLDDPAAQSCAVQLWEGNVSRFPGPGLAVYECRLRFVITSIEPASAP